jgi:hypothetical protein
MNGYDYGRKIIHMPGFKVEAWIDPTLISPRVKKAAQKMIRLGILNGGYRSTACMLAQQLLTDAGIKSTASANKWGVTIHNATLTQDTKADIINLLEAGRMIEIADKPESNHAYIDARYRRAMALELRGDHAISMSCYVVPIAQQIAEIAAASRSQAHKDAANKLADQLDDVAPIKANIHTRI